MKRFHLFLVVLIGLIVFLDYRGYQYAENPDPNHTHADFAIYIDGEKLDFSEMKYMSGVSWDEGSHDEADEYHDEHLHLHDEVGHVLHRHKPGLSVGQFLESLGFSMKEGCMKLDNGNSVCSTGLNRNDWRMFVNEAEQDPDSSYVFEDMDQILFTYGSSEEEVQLQLKDMTDDSCLYSRTCPWRGDPPEENCIADPDVPCTVPLGDL